jgi:hypothetical protein
VIADLGVHHVAGHVLRCGYTMQPIAPDYGLDQALMTYNQRGHGEPGVIWVQVKATDHPQRAKGQAALRRDLLSWVAEQYPVILVLYDAPADRAYWLHVQDEFSGGKVFQLSSRGSTITVHIPLAQSLTEEAVRQFRQLKKAAIARWQ